MIDSHQTSCARGGSMNLQAMIPMIFLAGLFLAPNRVFEEDIYPTGSGDLRITFIGHGSLKIEFNAKIIQIDPVARYADYSAECDADLILVTHDHGDHVADAAKAFTPDVLYPYHFGGTDPARLIELLNDTTEIKVLVRKMN